MSFNKRIEDLINKGYSQTEIIAKYDSFRKEGFSDNKDIFIRKVQKIIIHMEKRNIYSASNIYSDEDDYNLDYTSKLGASKQKGQDVNRELRKENREAYRLFNTLESLYDSISKQLKNFNITKLTKRHESSGDFIPIIHLSDLHFGEVIDLPGNSFNYEIAAKRLALFADNIKKLCRAYGCKDVVIAMTGDMVNASHVLSKIVLNAESQARISIQATFILKEFILDLNKEFNVSIACVVGNESRIIMKNFDEFQSSDENLATNSFDYLLFNMLKMTFSDAKGVSFIGGNFLEKVINVNGQNILLTHGTNIPAASPMSQVSKLIAHYAKKGILIDYAMFGHIHSTSISDSFCRSGGLPGANGYSESKALIGKASQNVVFVGKDGTRHAIMVDIQNISSVEGYEVLPIDDNLSVLEAPRTGKVVLEVIT